MTQNDTNDVILDYLDMITDNVYMLRNKSMSETERMKLLREVEDIAYILKGIIRSR